MPAKLPKRVAPIEHLYHGAGNSDVIHRSGGYSSIIFGDDGDNQLYGFGGGDLIYGAGGDDRLVGDLASLGDSPGNDTLDGGDGNDVLIGNAGDDALAGGADDDWLEGGPGADVLDGGTGNDTADYRNSPDGVAILFLTNKGRGGDAEGDTYISIENVYGSIHKDYLWGDANCNVLHGNDGDDSLYGGGFDDVLWGDGGNDSLQGGPGNDHLHGGSGNDKFVFALYIDGHDTIYDFVAGGTEDWLDVRGSAYNFSTLQEVLDHTTMVNGNAVIDLANGNSVTLIGVNAASLTAADFIF